MYALSWLPNFSMWYLSTILTSREGIPRRRRRLNQKTNQEIRKQCSHRLQPLPRLAWSRPAGHPCSLAEPETGPGWLRPCSITRSRQISQCGSATCTIREQRLNPTLHKHIGSQAGLFNCLAGPAHNFHSAWPGLCNGRTVIHQLVGQLRTLFGKAKNNFGVMKWILSLCISIGL